MELENPIVGLSVTVLLGTAFFLSVMVTFVTSLGLMVVVGIRITNPVILFDSNKLVLVVESLLES